MKILMCSSEVGPFSKTGGLADVVGALSPELRSRGHDVRIVTPLHGSIDRKKYPLKLIHTPLGVPVGFGEKWCAVHETNLPGTDIPVYFIEHDQYFSRKEIYQYQGKDYDDNAERFAFFARACLQVCKAINFAPDVAHCHDWQAGLVPVYLKSFEAGNPLLRQTASVMTIHNVGYQGIFPKHDLVHCQLGWEAFTPGCLEFYGQVNYLKAGILFADKVSTVSPTYAREIQTAEHGWQLDGALRARSPDLVGILNGCDYNEWNPSKDSLLPAQFDVDDLAGKRLCKRKLQEMFDLRVADDVPLFGIVTRLAYQKGVDELAAALPEFLQYQLQLAVLGTGEIWAHFVYGGLPIEFPGNAGVYIGFDPIRAHLIYAGSDFFLMPSRYEPCGLSQMAAMRYGSLPVARATGGIKDTVENYDESTGDGTGFLFEDLTSAAIANAIGWANATYYDRKPHFAALVDRAMRQRFLWSIATDKYEHLFLWALERKRGV